MFIAPASLSLELGEVNFWADFPRLLKVTKSFLFKISHLIRHSSCETHILIFTELFCCKLLSTFVFHKKAKQVSEGGVVKEAILSSFTVLIHGFPHNWEVHRGCKQERVVFAVTVAKHEHLKHVRELKGLTLAVLGESLYQTGMVRGWEFSD